MFSFFSNRGKQKQSPRMEDLPAFPVYDEAGIKSDPTRAGVKVVPFPIGRPAPVLLVCPGGAYEIVSDINEGLEIAEAFNARGFHAVVLYYRIKADAANERPVEDVAAAMRWIAKNASGYQMDASKVFLCGFSAGGHLAAYYAATAMKKGNPVPNGLVLGYPVISMYEQTHGRSRDLFLADRKNDVQAQKNASVDLIAQNDFPPAFLFHCEDDTAVPPSNSTRLVARLHEVGVKNELRLYPTGGHGVGCGKGTSADGWVNLAADFLSSLC